MECYITMGGIHCWWSGPYPSWNVWHRWEELLAASIWAPHSSHHVISAVADSQTAHKMPDLGYPFCTEKEMLYCNNRCTLLLNCFILFLWCIRWIRGASGSIYRPLVGRIAPFLLRPTLKLSNKIPDLGHPLITDNGVIYCWNRHPLRLKYFISCLLFYTEGGMSLWQHLWATYS